MSSAYLGAHILAALASIAVAAIVVLSIAPIATDEFHIDAPEVDDFEWSFSYGEITASAPLNIINGGTFDVDDVVVTVLVSNSSKIQLLSAVSHWGTIQSGSQVNQSINFSLEVQRLLDDGFEWMLTHSESLQVKVNVTARYSMKLVGLSADYEFEIPWSGLVQATDLGALSLHNDSGEYNTQVPFYLTTADFLHGLSGNYSVALSNGTGSFLSSSGQNVSLGTNDSGTLHLALDEDVAQDLLMNDQTLTMEMKVRLPSGSEITFVKQIDWSAPMHW